jgi:S1-C subfamily serine protease
LQADDLIVYVDGELCPSVKAFRDIIKQTNPGVTLQLEVQRGTQLKTIKLTLEEFPKGK